MASQMGRRETDGRQRCHVHRGVLSQETGRSCAHGPTRGDEARFQRETKPRLSKLVPTRGRDPLLEGLLEATSPTAPAQREGWWMGTVVVEKPSRIPRGQDPLYIRVYGAHATHHPFVRARPRPCCDIYVKIIWTNISLFWDEKRGGAISLCERSIGAAAHRFLTT